MSVDTRAFFVVSSGRSGTAMLHKTLSASGDVDMHHEYMVHIVQPLAVRRYMGLIDRAEAKRVLTETHAASVRYSEKEHWGDSSNKLAWLIPELAELFPESKFVHLVRDGRKVASSYFHKLGGECYDDRSTEVLRAHVGDPVQFPPPPPEKKYWWPLPRKSDPVAAAYRNFDQFQRIAWHWSEINRVILEACTQLTSQRYRFIRLEDLRGSPDAVCSLYEFLNLRYREDNFASFARPHNVNRAEDKLLDTKQRSQFEIIAGAMMERLGYASRKEYVVNY